MRWCQILHEGVLTHSAERMIDAFDDALDTSPWNHRVRVSLQPDPRDPEYSVELVHIQVSNRDDRNKGYASKAMQMLTDMADRFGTTLTLGVAEDADGFRDTLTRDELRDWYERWGFDGGATMRRKPIAH